MVEERAREHTTPCRLQPAGRVSIMALMTSDDRQKSAEQPADPAEDDALPPSAARDLADGLELMLRAARKAMKNVDAGKLEELGRRAMRGLEQVDRQKVQELGRKAVRNLDPRRVEEVAEDAGRELLAVVERVAERIDGMIGGAKQRSETSGGSTAPDAGDERDPEQPRIRIDTERK